MRQKAMCTSIAACVRDFLPHLVLLQGVCPDETRHALRVVREIGPTLPQLCVNVTVQARVSDAFASVRDLARCAVTYGGFSASHLGRFGMPLVRNFLCGPPPTLAPAPPPATPWVPWWRGVALGALAVACATTAGVHRARLKRRRTPPVAALVAVLAWLLVGLATAPTLLREDKSFAMSDFYYRDGTTACHFEFAAVLPDADVQRRTLSVHAPTRRVKDVYRHVRALPVQRTSLRELCGHCDLQGDADVVRHLVLDGAAPSHSSTATFHLVLPAFAPRAWRRALAQALERTVDEDVVFVSREQAEADVRASTRVEPTVVICSVLLTFVTLLSSVTAFTRSASALLLTLGVLGVVAAALFVGDGVRAALGVAHSPYALVVVPVCLGTGVDSALILLTTYQRSGRFDHAWPSILGSGLTSACSFAAGLLLRVPHLQSLFATGAATFLASTALGVLAFPPCIRACVPKRRVAPEATAHEPHGRLLWKPALAALVVLWVSLLPFVHPVGTSADLTYTIAEHSMTRRFLDHTRATAAPPPSVVYAFVRDSASANWTDVHARLAAAGATPVLDWHAAYLESAEPSLASWRAHAATRFVFGPLLGERASALVASAPYASSATDADALRALHAHDSEGVCFAQEDRMGGYTVDVIARRLWILALAAVTCSTAVGVAIAGRHGAAVLPALVLSYGTMTAVLGATRTPAHMLLVAAYAVSPGFLVDFQIHLAYNPDTRVAVLTSAATSVASMVPYVFTHLPGVRDFAVCYVGFLVIGVLHAFLATVTRSIHGWEAL